MGVVLLMDIGTAIWDAIDGDIGWNNTTLALVMSIGVTVCYIVGNSFLYDGMRRRNATEVRGRAPAVVCAAIVSSRHGPPLHITCADNRASLAPPGRRRSLPSRRQRSHRARA